MSKPELPQNFEQWYEAYNPVPQAGSVAAFGHELRDAYESGYDYGYRKALEDAAKVCKRAENESRIKGLHTAGQLEGLIASGGERTC